MRKIALAFALILGLANGAAAQAPTPVPALPDSQRLTTYSISGTTCACSVGFQIYGSGADVDEWIQVYVNGVAKLSTDPTFGWSLSVPVGTLASVARPITNAVLTFNAVQTATVVIVGSERPRRLSQFPENRGVAARDLNQAITDQVAVSRELWDKLNRAIVGQPGDVLLPLPSVAARASQALCFDGLGNPMACSGGAVVPTNLFSTANLWTALQTFSGGISTATTTDPTGLSCVPPTFGASWTCLSYLSSSSTPTHGDWRATLGLNRVATGSGQAEGGASDAALIINASKLNYLSSAIQGDIQAAFITGAQGLRGDIGGLQTAVSKVFGGTGGAVALEQAAFWTDASGNNLMQVHSQVASATSGAIWGLTGSGYISESWGATVAVAASQITPYSSYYGGTFDANGNCPTHCPTFSYLLVGAANRSGLHQFFSITMGNNEEGRIIMGSPSALGLDGNATASGGVQLSFVNQLGSLNFYTSANAFFASLTQAGIFALGNAAGIGGTLALAGSASGFVSIKPQAAAGTFNFNLPITAGSAGNVLASGGGGAAPMTWITGVTTVCTITAGNSYTFTNGVLTTKGANCT